MRAFWQYADGEELTACYGPEYHRAYATANFGPPPTARVPADSFDEAHVRHATWPTRVPGWWNPEMQPINRPALKWLSLIHI